MMTVCIRVGKEPPKMARMETKPVKSRVITKCGDCSTWAVWGEVLPRTGEQQSWVWDLRVEVSESLLPVVVLSLSILTVVYIMIHQREGCHQSLEYLNLDCGCWRATIRLRWGWSVVTQVHLAIQRQFQVCLTYGRLKARQFNTKESWFDHRHCRSQRLKKDFAKNLTGSWTSVTRRFSCTSRLRKM